MGVGIDSWVAGRPEFGSLEYQEEDFGVEGIGRVEALDHCPCGRELPWETCVAVSSGWTGRGGGRGWQSETSFKIC